MPYTIMEAKMSGIPVISTNVGSISKIIQDKKTGILIEPENTTKLAESLIYSYEHQDEMIEMSTVNKNQNLPEYLKNTMILKTDSVYQDFLGKL